MPILEKKNLSEGVHTLLFKELHNYNEGQPIFKLLPWGKKQVNTVYLKLRNKQIISQITEHFLGIKKEIISEAEAKSILGKEVDCLIKKAKRNPIFMDVEKIILVNKEGKKVEIITGS